MNTRNVVWSIIFYSIPLLAAGFVLTGMNIWQALIAAYLSTYVLWLGLGISYLAWSWIRFRFSERFEVVNRAGMVIMAFRRRVDGEHAIRSQPISGLTLRQRTYRNETKILLSQMDMPHAAA